LTKLTVPQVGVVTVTFWEIIDNIWEMVQDGDIL